MTIPTEAGGDTRFDRLLEASVRLAGGDLAVRVEPGDRGDDLDALIVSFNMLGEELAESVRALQMTRDELRLRVEERTSELATARDEQLEQRQVLESVLKNIKDGVVVADEKGLRRFLNPAAERILGRTINDPIPAEWPGGYGIFYPDGVTPFPDSALPITRAVAGEATENVEMIVRNPKLREEIRVMVTGTPLVDEEGNRCGGVVVFRDITEQERSARALREANEQLQKTVGALERRNEEMGLLTELGDLLLACNHAEEAYNAITYIASQLFDGEQGAVYAYSPSRNDLEVVTQWGAEMENQDERIFGPDECWALRRGRIHATYAYHHSVRCPHIARAAPGSYLCIPMMAHGETLGLLHLRLNPPSSEVDGKKRAKAKEQLAITFAEHISLALSNLRLRETLRFQSIRDPLTGLFNRRYLEETLARELRRAERSGHSVSALMVDLDHFKRFNDSFGHDAGDVLLREFGTFLRNNMRGGDIACRYGGEEFMLIFPEMPPEIAVTRGETLRQGLLELAVSHRGTSLGGVTMSVGVACYPRDARSSNELLRCADLSLYQAKSLGRNCVVQYAPGLSVTTGSQ